MIKKIILFLVLLPVFSFAQTYPNISQCMSSTDWLYPNYNNGSGYGCVSISNDVLTVSFGGGWPSQEMKTGVIMAINVSPSLPDMDLGPIFASSGGNTTGYYAEIINNSLIFYTIGSPPITTGCFLNYSSSIQCPSTLWYRDADGDGFGTQAASTIGCPNSCAQISACAQPAGYVANNGDCNDASAAINPNTSWYIDKDHDGYGAGNYYNPPNGDFITYPPTKTGCVQPYGYANNYSDCDDTNASILSYVHWHPDADGDGFGNGAITSTSGCVPPIVGYISDGSDCNDTNATINPNTKWYRDADGDGFGTSATTTVSCTQPAGYVSNSTDCNDASAAINSNTVWYQDADGDGFGTSATTTVSCTQPAGYVSNSTDCNDASTTINPNTVWYRDADGDGNGNVLIFVKSCLRPTGYVFSNTDCDDTNASILSYVHWHPDADGDGFGNGAITSTSGCVPPIVGYISDGSDCNDTNATINPNTKWYRDADGDGFGTSATTTVSCTQPAGYVSNSTDCNDASAAINSNTVWYQDADGDGFGTSATTTVSCTQPAGYVSNSTDCNDASTTINPNTVWYRDADGDGNGNVLIFVKSCLRPTGYVFSNTDCDDTNASILSYVHWHPDADGDGFGNGAITSTSGCVPPIVGYISDGSDCNDTNATINPNTKWYRDADGDGFGTSTTTTLSCTKPAGYVGISTDCNDDLASINPNTVWYRDADGDGFGTSATTTVSCTQPAGYVSNSTDSNDTNAAINPNTVVNCTPPVGTLKINTTKLCANNPIEFVFDTKTNGLTYDWLVYNDGDDENYTRTTTSGTQSFTLNSPYAYSLSLRITTADGCVFNQPVISFNVASCTPCNYCASFDLVKDEKYLVSGWVQESDPALPLAQAKTYIKSCIGVTFNDTAGVTIGTQQKYYATGDIIDGWQRIVGEFVVPSTVLEMKLDLINENTTPSTSMAYFDDIRVLPSKGNMKSFVYDQATQRLMAELDENNYSTFYEYDLEGGLVRVKKETEKGVFTIQETRSGNAKQ